MSAEVATKETPAEAGEGRGAAQEGAANGAAQEGAACCAGKSAANASCSSPAAGSGCPLCRCLGWFAGMWRVLLAYLIGVGLLALLMTIMRRMQQ